MKFPLICHHYVSFLSFFTHTSLLTLYLFMFLILIAHADFSQLIVKSLKAYLLRTADSVPETDFKLKGYRRDKRKDKYN